MLTTVKECIRAEESDRTSFKEFYTEYVFSVQDTAINSEFRHLTQQGTMTIPKIDQMVVNMLKRVNGK